MSFWIAGGALLLIVVVGLAAIFRDWVDDHRLLLAMLFLAMAIIASTVPVSVYARLAAHLAG